MLRFATAWIDGRALSIEQAIALATEDLPAADAGSHRPSLQGAAPAGLSPREVEVVRLLVRGLTDREIAEALFISRRTASDHVTHVLRKLGVPNRREAAAWAIAQGLGEPRAPGSVVGVQAVAGGPRP